MAWDGRVIVAVLASGDRQQQPSRKGQQMTRPRLYSRTIHRACASVGGPVALSRRLKVGVNTVFNWLEGLEEVPAKAFLECVDIVLASDSAQGPAGDAAEMRPRADQLSASGGIKSSD